MFHFCIEETEAQSGPAAQLGEDGSGIQLQAA